MRVEHCPIRRHRHLKGYPPNRLGYSPRTIPVAQHTGGIKRLLKLVAANPGSHVVCEATGGYERTLLHTLWAEDHPVTLFNPKRVRGFARGTNRLAKTDSIDACVIRDYAITVKPARTQPPSAALVRLKDLCSRRDDLLAQRLAEANRSRMLADKVLLRQSRCLLKQLDSHIADLERWMRETIDADPPLSDKVRTLCSVKGVGFIVAVSVLALPSRDRLAQSQILCCSLQS